MELAQITAGQVVMLFLLMGTGIAAVVLQVGGFFGGHFHAAAAEHRGVQRGVQHMQDRLMNDDLHKSGLISI